MIRHSDGPSHRQTKQSPVFDNRSHWKYKIFVMTKYLINFFISIIFLVLLTFDIVVDNRKVFYEIYCGPNKTVPKYTNAPKDCKGKCEHNLYRSICLRGECVTLWQNHTKLWEEFDKPSATTTEPTRLLLLKKRKKYGVGRKFNDYGMHYEKHAK